MSVTVGRDMNWLVNNNQTDVTLVFNSRLLNQIRRRLIVALQCTVQSVLLSSVWENVHAYRLPPTPENFKQFILIHRSPSISIWTNFLKFAGVGGRRSTWAISHAKEREVLWGDSIPPTPANFKKFVHIEMLGERCNMSHIKILGVYNAKFMQF